MRFLGQKRQNPSKIKTIKNQNKKSVPNKMLQIFSSFFIESKKKF